MTTPNSNDLDKGHGNDLKHPLLNAIRDGVAVIQEFSEKVIESEQTTFESYFKKKAAELDSLIVNLEKKGLGKYVAGEVSLSMEEADHFSFQADFYFKDVNGAWIKRSVKSKSAPLKWFFLPDEQDRLRFEKKITFEYNHP